MLIELVKASVALHLVRVQLLAHPPVFSLVVAAIVVLVQMEHHVLVRRVKVPPVSPKPTASMQFISQVEIGQVRIGRCVANESLGPGKAEHACPEQGGDWGSRGVRQHARTHVAYPCGTKLQRAHHRRPAITRVVGIGHNCCPGLPQLSNQGSLLIQHGLLLQSVGERVPRQHRALRGATAQHGQQYVVPSFDEPCVGINLQHVLFSGVQTLRKVSCVHSAFRRPKRHVHLSNLGLEGFRKRRFCIASQLFLKLLLLNLQLRFSDALQEFVLAVLILVLGCLLLRGLGDQVDP
mmetsp:Transcript_11620/g.22042  ORF Transcript_11620/g.22042 Transcript_11620/m.22042 type:complete len:293 (+) Transcript_11620:376-1254(+)